MSVAALDAIARACFRSFSNLPNARILDDGCVYGIATDVPLTFFNGIATSQLDRDDVPRVIAQFEGRPFRWWISPSARPVDLDAVLLEHGLRHAFDSTGMAADLTTLRDVATPRELTIERVSDLSAWIDVFLPGFHKPAEERDAWLGAYARCGDEWVHFVGRVNGVPIATTSLLLDGDLAGVYHVVTLPDHRGRGIGAAMTHAAMRVARDAGARTAVLQASEMGEGVYRSVGFEAVCTLTLYDWRP